MRNRLWVASVASVVLLVFSLMFFGCSNEMSVPRMGSLTLSKPGSRTIEPNKDLIEVSSYKVSGAGPGGASFTPIESSTTPITINNLVEGTWSITVEGLNSENTTIATQTLDVVIVSGNKTHASFLLQWIEGYGNVDVIVTWPSTLTTFTRIHGVLSQGEAEVKTFDLLTSEATTTDTVKTITQSYTELATGSYDFILTFYDSNDSRVGLPYMDQVNIYHEMTSSGICTIPEVLLPIEPPVITPNGGKLTAGQTISITSASEDVKIYYTLDGSNPTISSMLYTEAIVLGNNATLKAIALSPDRFASEMVSADFIVPVATPVFSVSGGVYDSFQTVTITTITSGATIYYTLDGSTPTEESTVYASPLEIKKDTTLKAIAIHPESEASAIVTAVYEILGSSGLDISNPSYLEVTLQLPEGWEAMPVASHSAGVAKAHITSEGEVTYVWYLDGELAMNNSNAIASTGNTLSFGAGEGDVLLDVGPHVLTVKVTKDSMTYSDQKLISVTPAEITHVVSFDSQGGSTPDPVTKSVVEGNAYGTLPSPTREGYAFGGWYSSPNGEGAQITSASMVSAHTDHTLYAAWTVENPFISVRLTSTTDPTDIREATLLYGPYEDGTEIYYPHEIPGVPVAITTTYSSGKHNATTMMATNAPQKLIEFGGIQKLTDLGRSDYLMISIPLDSHNEKYGVIDFDVPQLFPEYDYYYISPPYQEEQTPIFTYTISRDDGVGGYFVGSAEMSNLILIGRNFYDKEHMNLGEYHVDVEFYVKRVPAVHYYKLTYDLNKGVEGNWQPSDDCLGGDLVGLPGYESWIEREGFVLEGWNTQADGRGDFYPAGSLFSMPNHDLILYAMWIPQETLISEGPAGGYVFYDKGEYSDGWRYLEAAPYGWYDGNTDSRGCYSGMDDPYFEWGANDSIYEVTPSAKARALGSGKENTINIVAFHDSLGTSYPELGDYYTHPKSYNDKNDGTVAAKVCLEYSLVKDGVTYDDWYLPSHEELYLMYATLASQGVGNFNTDRYSYYWSSSEHDDPEWVRALLFGDPGPYMSATKNNTFRVRPIRSY